MMNLAPAPHRRAPVTRVTLPSPWTRLARIVRWLSLLAGAHAALAAAGRVLPTPPAPWSGADLAGWLASTDPGTSAFALLRLLALAIAWYLTVVTALVLLSRLSGIPHLISLADRAAVPVVRRALHHAIGVGLAVTIIGSSGSLLTGTAPASADPVGEPVVTMQVVEDEHGTPPDARPPEVRPPHAGGGPEVHMVLLEETPPVTEPAVPPPPPTVAPPDATSAATAPPVSIADPPLPASPATPTADGPSAPAPDGRDPASPPPTPAGAATPATTPSDAHAAPSAGETVGTDAAAPTPSPATTEWTISPGDHLWHVAEQTLHDKWQRPPTDDETAAYWRGLIADNRDRLVDAGNPDLVFPGQRFRLPPVPTG